MSGITADYTNIVSVPANTFTKAGYSYSNWNTEANATGSNYYPSDNFVMPVNGDTLFAIWYGTLTFDKNHVDAVGTMPTQDFIDNKTNALISNRFSRPGYGFGGWATTPGGADEYSDKDDYVMTTGDQTLYAVWSSNDYIITFYKNAADATGTMSDQTIACGATENLNSVGFSRTGYTFAGWAETSDGAVVYTDNESYTMGVGDVELYAKWTPIVYNITYNLNGSVNAPENPASYTIESNTITFSSPTKPGYTFNGWSTSSIAAGSTGNVSTTASWGDIVNYSITYNLNGGANAPENPSSYTIESDTIAFADPSRTGYIFDGWTLGSISAGSTGAKTTTANWTPIVYYITYNMNGGNNAPENPLSYTIESNTITFSAPTKTGYAFNNWSTPSIPAGSTGNVSTTASWGDIVNYSITYNLNGGANAPENPSSYTIESDTIAFADPSKTGYTFDGWSIDSISAGSTGNVLTTANWFPTTYNITYNLNGGDNAAENPSSYNIENDTITFVAPAKAGYSFEGWSTTSIPAGSVGAISTTASWGIIHYSITYYLNGADNNVLNINSYTVKSNKVLYDPNLSNFTFKGWYTENTYNTQISSINSGQTGNLNLYAKWVGQIEFNKNGGTSGTMGVQEILRDTIESLSENQYIKLGHSFLGWSDFNLFL